MSGVTVGVGLAVGMGAGVGVGKMNVGTVPGRNQSVVMTPSG